MQLDWQALVAYAVCILGLSLMLATHSYRRWLVNESRVRVPVFDADRILRIAWKTGILLALLGWGLSRHRWWEIVVWMGIAGWLIGQ